MPNPLGRHRRTESTGGDSAEVTKLKDELNELRKMYMQDMASVSSDMRVLVSQLAAQNQPVADTPAADTPAPDTPAG